MGNFNSVPKDNKPNEPRKPAVPLTCIDPRLLALSAPELEQPSSPTSCIDSQLLVHPSSRSSAPASLPLDSISEFSCSSFRHLSPPPLQQLQQQPQAQPRRPCECPWYEPCPYRSLSPPTRPSPSLPIRSKALPAGSSEECLVSSFDTETIFSPTYIYSRSEIVNDFDKRGGFCGTLERPGDVSPARALCTLLTEWKYDPAAVNTHKFVFAKRVRGQARSTRRRGDVKGAVSMNICNRFQSNRSQRVGWKIRRDFLPSRGVEPRPKVRRDSKGGINDLLFTRHSTAFMTPVQAATHLAREKADLALKSEVFYARWTGSQGEEYTETAEVVAEKTLQATEEQMEWYRNNVMEPVVSTVEEDDKDDKNRKDEGPIKVIEAGYATEEGSETIVSLRRHDLKAVAEGNSKDQANNRKAAVGNNTTNADKGTNGPTKRKNRCAHQSPAKYKRCDSAQSQQPH